jgi:hypothetical protein
MVHKKKASDENRRGTSFAGLFSLKSYRWARALMVAETCNHYPHIFPQLKRTAAFSRQKPTKALLLLKT